MVLTRTKSSFHINEPTKGDVDLNAKTRHGGDRNKETSHRKKDQTNKKPMLEDPMNEDNEFEETNSVDPGDNSQVRPVDDDVEKEGDLEESDNVIAMARKLKINEEKLSLQEKVSLLMHKKMARMEAIIMNAPVARPIVAPKPGNPYPPGSPHIVGCPRNAQKGNTEDQNEVTSHHKDQLGKDIILDAPIFKNDELEHNSSNDVEDDPQDTSKDDPQDTLKDDHQDKTTDNDVGEKENLDGPDLVVIMARKFQLTESMLS
uniref:Uncharacterized protein n=1 Tax=Cannabis sativa TaxID=3483 RepID=A0A803PT43_CANSA